MLPSLCIQSLSPFSNLSLVILSKEHNYVSSKQGLFDLFLFLLCFRTMKARGTQLKWLSLVSWQKLLQVKGLILSSVEPVFCQCSYADTIRVALMESWYHGRKHQSWSFSKQAVWTNHRFLFLSWIESNLIGFQSRLFSERFPNWRWPCFQHEQETRVCDKTFVCINIW